MYHYAYQAVCLFPRPETIGEALHVPFIVYRPPRLIVHIGSPLVGCDFSGNPFVHGLRFKEQVQPPLCTELRLLLYWCLCSLSWLCWGCCWQLWWWQHAVESARVVSHVAFAEANPGRLPPRDCKAYIAAPVVRPCRGVGCASPPPRPCHSHEF